jgi:lysozyme family protein
MIFEMLLAEVLKREGGYTNHPNDRGGATNLGIIQRVYTDWLAKHGRPYADVRGITRDEAAAIYLENYWIPAKTDLIPAAVRDIHFDSAVNHGVGRAAKLLQAAAGVEQDGSIGPVTLAAAGSLAPALLRAKYIAARYRFYGQIINRDRSQLAFIAGWMNRMAEFA